ncbi:LON peptidase substrate-binding domain-containing protein [Uliginosibacterium sp. 31-16]|uniref:LON peptidase substrate-binding domain-containing protein n=1 Tax=Uliginosibacterium sp. 31-16 TaxID=3068315 RepID=UPI00273EBABC|nr:LON peptidase substrate-binding domain-containing protein [Uliginosibacterium sp. 31-16]MDP5239397.1 LON peptidase substrate-binding domain-containing protein [Uliginosibacterium sp. 31-16]
MSEPLRLPLFPLNCVLFPHGRLNLRIFEVRYLDMIAGCMKADAPFGVCLIVEGEEVGTPAVPHLVGCEARIVDWDMSEPGILGLTVRGGRRFRVLEQGADEHGVITGIVQWFDEPAGEAVSADHEAMLPLLQMVLQDAGEKVIPRPYALGDAAWVGYRYAEILPIPNLARQRLLELEDADLRLAIIHEYLVEHELLKD